MTRILSSELLERIRPIGRSAPTQITSLFFDMIPVGYFAATLDEESVKFFRVKIAQKNSQQFLPGAKVIQQAHGSGLSLRYSPVMELRPSTGVFAWTTEFDSYLMTIAVDNHHAALLFGQAMGNCCRCNADLTDDRSRWYGLGPECEKVFGWVITEVDDSEKGPYRP